MVYVCLRKKERVKHMRSSKANRNQPPGKPVQVGPGKMTKEHVQPQPIAPEPEVIDNGIKPQRPTDEDGNVKEYEGRLMLMYPDEYINGKLVSDDYGGEYSHMGKVGAWSFVEIKKLINCGTMAFFSFQNPSSKEYCTVFVDENGGLNGAAYNDRATNEVLCSSGRMPQRLLGKIGFLVHKSKPTIRHGWNDY
jgi:hypothetical protein